MRRSVFSLAAVLFVSFFMTAKAQAITFNEIDFWVGSGANQAAFVLDWSDGKPGLIWGYQWDGVATAQQMFEDVFAADDRLHAKLSTFAWGTAIIGVGYDRDNDGFALSDGTTFIDGVSIGAPSDGVVSLDADDSYIEGWNSGFWAFYLANENPYTGDTWDGAQVGIRDAVLENGAFFGFEFAPGFVGTAPTAEPTPAPAPTNVSVAMPEPASLIMLGMSAVALMIRRR